jgi:cell division protein FtsL
MAIEVVFEKRINNAAVYSDVDTEQRRQYFLLVGLAALFMVGLLFYGWQQYQWRQAGYEIESAQKKVEELTDFQKQLQVERASKALPGRIDKIARERLGMTAAAPGQLVTFSADAPMTIPSARPADVPAVLPAAFPASTQTEAPPLAAKR